MNIDKMIKTATIFKYVNIIACIMLTFFACTNAIGGSIWIMLLDAAMAVFYFKLIFDRKEEIVILKELKKMQDIIAEDAKITKVDIK